MASPAAGRAPAVRSLASLLLHRRRMTRGRSVRERSSRKRWHDLEIAARRHKAAAKLIAVVDALKAEDEHVMPARRLELLRPQLGLRRPHRAADFVRRSPELFQFCRDSAGGLWCGLTDAAEELVGEEARLLEENSPAAAVRVAKLLMMSEHRRLELNKIVHFRRDFGLSPDFRERWADSFPELFRPVRSGDADCLELVSWRPDLAVPALEKKSSSRFVLKFPPKFDTVHRHRRSIEEFHAIEFRSPYAGVAGLEKGSKEFDKRAVAVIHEMLSLTLERRIVTDHLTHFRPEMGMPQKLMRLLLKHCGIFYVAEGSGKRYSVFLNEAYDGAELKEKEPLVLWKEKLLRMSGFAGWRGRKLKLSGGQLSDAEDYLFGGSGGIALGEADDGDEMFEESILEEDSEMELGVWGSDAENKT